MDTSNARRSILARIRAAQRRPEIAGAEERANVADYLARHPAGPRRPHDADLLPEFSAQAVRMTSTLDTVTTLADVPTAVSRYLQALELPTHCVVWNSLANLDWASAGIDATFRAPRRTLEEDRDVPDLIGVTGCFCAIAETGSLMLVSGPDTPASTALLPETHIAVVPVARIVPDLEAAFALMRSEIGVLSRATNIISGPSRTADIEQNLVLGAHGPYRVHVVVVETTLAS
jgi:L-lactate dehydrogenase complex protein LldG